MVTKAVKKPRPSRPPARTPPRAAAGPRAVVASERGPTDLFTAEERATLALFSVEGIGPATLAGLRQAFGTLAEALAAPVERVCEHLRDEPTRNRFRQLHDVGTLADRLFERAARVGAQVLFPGRPGWPNQLEGLAFPPLLYVRGTLGPAERRVAIVGSRDTDRYGEEVAAFFADGLAARSVSVVSGGALGVDGAAHRACLGRGAPTVAVLGSGVDIAYPGEHKPLFREILARGGAVVSHFPPGTPGVPQNFKVRNRLIAALAEAVIVARAGAGSGALGTAAAALELRRPVFAVPGDVTCPLAAGVNALLEEGKARACTGLSPVARALDLGGEDWPSAVPGTGKGRKPTARSVAAPPKKAVRAERPQVPAELALVWEALGREPVQFDELLRRSRLDAAGLANALVRLEVLGLCEERLGKVFVRT